MNVRDAPSQPAPAPRREDPYPGQKARGGEIVLTTPLRRAIFLAGLIVAIFLALLLSLLVIA